MFDGKSLGEQMVVIVRDFVMRATAGLSAQIDELRASIKAIPAGSPGERGVPGEKGMDGAPGTAGRDGINGKDGAPGRDGLPGDRGQQGEKGLDGTPGRDGRDGKDGQDGKSISVEDVSLLVRAAVAEIPAPVNGKDGCDGVNGKDGAPGERGIDGAPGTKGDPGQQGEKGLPGDRGEKGDRGESGAQGEQGPPGKDGAPGIAGKDGAPGLNGKDADLDLVRAEIALAVKALPPAKDGRDGRDAPPVDVDAVVKAVLAQVPAPAAGRDGERGIDGADGKSITVDDVRGVLEAECARMQLEFERRAADTLQRAIDRMPAPKDGRDALSVDDFDVSLEGRTFTFALRCGDRVVTKSIDVPLPLYRGVYRPGQSCKAGDAVTHSGSVWIAKRDTSEAPPSEAWQLAVKRGADGKGAA